MYKILLTNLDIFMNFVQIYINDSFKYINYWFREQVLFYSLKCFQLLMAFFLLYLKLFSNSFAWSDGMFRYEDNDNRIL